MVSEEEKISHAKAQRCKALPRSKGISLRPLRLCVRNFSFLRNLQMHSSALRATSVKLSCKSCDPVITSLKP
jgi:hypothetical protein